MISLTWFYCPQFSGSPVILGCSFPALRSLVNTIAQAVRCCRHFVADHGAESLLPSNCQSVHFMVHILRSPFVRVPLAPMLISLTLSHTNNNKSNAHFLYLTATACLTQLGFRLRCVWWHVIGVQVTAEHVAWAGFCFCFHCVLPIIWLFQGLYKGDVMYVCLPCEYATSVLY